MKKGFRFQTKLFFAFFVAISLVAMAIIHLTSERVKATYQRQFKENFERQVEFLMEAREKRSSDQLSLSRTMAKDPLVIGLLQNNNKHTSVEKALFNKRLNAESSPAVQKMLAMKGPAGGKGIGGASRNNNGPARGSRFIAVMDLDGEMKEISGAAKAVAQQGQKNSKKRVRKRPVFRKLENFIEQDIQHIIFHALPSSLVMDVIVTPVKDPDSGKVIGALLMSPPFNGTTATTAERFIDRYQEQIGGSHFENAIYLNGEIYPSKYLGKPRDNDQDEESLFDHLEAATAAKLAQMTEDKDQGTFVSQLHGEPHYIHYCALNPDSPLTVAYQISAFPMTELRADLNDLRIKGSGIGLVGMLIGLIVAWFFARNLSVPIRELSAGTHKVRDGNLDIELAVRSGDEIGDLTESFNQMTAELRQKEHYRQLLGKVSDESVAQAMIEGTLNPELGGELKEVTVLFCDIRGFTNLTETMRPEQVIELLNQHMTALTNVVRDHFGVVDKFVGDEIMAVFGGLKSYGNDAENAARCGLKMIEERERLNRENGTDIQIGIGIASGEIVAGCMGSQDRLNYTVLGARVNLGARLCGRAGAGEVIIDDQTFEKIRGLNPTTETIEGLMLKGFSVEMQASKLQNMGDANAIPVVV